MMILIRRIVCVAAAVGLVGCADLAPEIPETGWFTASIVGRSSPTYRGSGEFYVGRWENGSPQFSLKLDGSDQDARGLFLVQGSFEGVAKPGAYAIRLPDFDGPPVRPKGAFWMIFVRQGGDGGTVRETYRGVGGEVRIDDSSSESVAGSFRFTGVRMCPRMTSERQAGCGYTPPEPGAPTIEIAGSFVAVPSSNDAQRAILRHPVEG
jgi:hypothetical protein